MAIYLKIQDSVTFTNIKELLLFGYTVRDRFVITYSDVNCTRQQCHAAYRSFEDLLEICQTYFPATTKHELAALIYNERLILAIVPYYCFNIDKLVFFKGTNNEYGTKYKWENHISSISKRNKEGNGQYCFNDIMYLLIDIPK